MDSREYNLFKECLLNTSKLTKLDIWGVISHVEKYYPQFNLFFGRFKDENFLSKDVIRLMLMKSELKDVLSWCQTSKKYQSVCTEEFWRDYVKNNYQEESLPKGMTWRELALDLETERLNRLVRERFHEIVNIIRHGTLTQLKKSLGGVTSGNILKFFILSVEEAKFSFVKYFLAHPFFDYAQIEEYLENTHNLPNNLYELIGRNLREDFNKKPSERLSKKDQSNIKQIAKLFIESTLIPAPTERIKTDLMGNRTYFDGEYFAGSVEYFILYAFYAKERLTDKTLSWSKYFTRRGSKAPIYY